MSTSAPFEPHPSRPDEPIPAADPGAGAPPPAEGFGVEAEEPDRTEESAPDRLPGELPDPPFRTPDPEDVGRRSEG